MESILIKYIGNDLKYWSKIKECFKRDYGHLNLKFIEKDVTSNCNATNLFISTYYESPDIVYVDLSFQYSVMLSLLKLMAKNNVTRLKSTVGLHEYRQGQESLLKATLAGIRINHYKSAEITDLVYDPVSLLNVNLSVTPQFALGKELNKIVFKQILRLGYIDNDHIRVESNSLLELESFIELNYHPLEDVMESRRFYVESYSDSDLYYNQRYSYKLKYTYVDTPLFRSTEENWKLFKKYKNNPFGYEEETKKDYKYLVEDMNLRREKFSPIKKKILNWIDQREIEVIPKRLKILVIDETLEMFKELDGAADSFPYTINFQTHCTKDYYQVRRSKPHLIVYHYEKTGNNEEHLKKIVDVIAQYSDYNPIVLVFNYHNHSSMLRNLYNYQNILSYKDCVDLDVVREFAEKLDAKFKISNVHGKVFFKTSDPESVLTVTRQAKIKAMTESVVFFETKYDIPMWTVFIVEEPIKMLMTVVPLTEESHLAGEKNIYRALIHGVGEREKSRLRVLVNKSLEDYK